MIRRQKYIDTLSELISDTTQRYINIAGPRGVGKSVFLRELENDWFFGDEGTHDYHILEGGELPSGYTPKHNIQLLILDSEDSIPSDVWEDYLISLPHKLRVIFVTDIPCQLDAVSVIEIDGVSFREYAESKNAPIKIQSILDGTADVNELIQLRDLYIERGSYPHHLAHPEHILQDFEKKCRVIYLELFDKEQEQFFEYMRALAMNVGNVFKADGLAKLLGISRRKVNKYTELLLKYNIIKAIWPWVQNSALETSRHVKLYFTDLSYLKALLANTHYHGTQKLWAIENFIFLELNRKLDETHKIYYYRKKSGAEITFIIEDVESERITPIEVTLRETDVISQVFRIFDLDYHEKVERYMLVNNRLAGKKDLSGTLFIIIPHVAI
jgi:predicted AAA+ superfamily ATPase